MYKATSRAAAIVAGAAIRIVFDATAALAQVVQSEIGAEPGSSETTQLVTSSTEVRRAVVGLLVIAGLVALLTIAYWFKTGQQARQRFARRYGGRHLAEQGGHDVVDERGPWGTDTAYLDQTRPQPQPHSAYGRPVYAAQGSYPDHAAGSSGPYPDQAPGPSARYPNQPSPAPYPDHAAPPTPAARPTWTGQTEALTWPPPAQPEQAQPIPQGRRPARISQAAPPAEPEPRPRPQFFE